MAKVVDRVNHGGTAVDPSRRSSHPNGPGDKPHLAALAERGNRDTELLREREALVLDLDIAWDLGLLDDNPDVSHETATEPRWTPRTIHLLGILRPALTIVATFALLRCPA